MLRVEPRWPRPVVAPLRVAFASRGALFIPEKAAIASLSAVISRAGAGVDIRESRISSLDVRAGGRTVLAKEEMGI